MIGRGTEGETQTRGPQKATRGNKEIDKPVTHGAGHGKRHMEQMGETKGERAVLKRGEKPRESDTLPPTTVHLPFFPNL